MHSRLACGNMSDQCATVLFLDDHLTQTIYKHTKIRRRSTGKYSFVNARRNVKNTVNERSECNYEVGEYITKTIQAASDPASFERVEIYGHNLWGAIFRKSPQRLLPIRFCLSNAHNLLPLNTYAQTLFADIL